MHEYEIESAEQQELFEYWLQDKIDSGEAGFVDETNIKQGPFRRKCLDYSVLNSEISILQDRFIPVIEAIATTPEIEGELKSAGIIFNQTPK